MTAQHRDETWEIYQLGLARAEKAPGLFFRHQINLRVVAVNNERETDRDNRQTDRQRETDRQTKRWKREDNKTAAGGRRVRMRLQTRFAVCGGCCDESENTATAGEANATLWLVVVHANCVDNISIPSELGS